MMGARGSMAMRADIQLNNAGGVDGYGNPLPPNWVVETSNVPCRVYTRQRREVVSDDRIALVEDIRALFSLSAAIAESKRIINIKDRLGAVLYAGPLRIDTIQRRRDHLEAALRRVQSDSD